MKYLVLSLSLAVVATYASTNWTDEAGFNDIADSSYRLNGAVRIAAMLPTNSISIVEYTNVLCSVTNDFNQNYDPVQHKLDYARRLNSIPRPVAAIDELIEAIEELNKKVNQANSNKLEQSK